MYEPIAASTAGRRTAQTATSTLPNAPVRTEPGAAPTLRALAARGLVGLASRLDPDASAS